MAFEGLAEKLEKSWNRTNDYFDLYGTGKLVRFPVTHCCRPLKLFEGPGMQVVETREVPYAERTVDSENGMTVWDYSSGRKKSFSTSHSHTILSALRSLQRI